MFIKSHRVVTLTALTLFWLIPAIAYPQHEHHVQAEAEKRPLYFCPMHPQITSHEPGRCPICGMNLELREKTAPAPPASPDAALSPAGRSAFNLPTERQALIGVRRERAASGKITRVLRLPGRVTLEQELYQVLREYALARAHSEPRVIIGAGVKLRLMGLEPAQYESLAAADLNIEDFVLPRGKAWITLAAYEYEAPLLARDAAIEIHALGRPDLVFKGRVWNVGRVLDASSRTLPLRVLVDDPGAQLKPETYVEGVFIRESRADVVVPKSALLYQGAQPYVFVVDGGTRVEPRSVTLGAQDETRSEVRAGVRAGEEVVVAANFLLDSESHLQTLLDAAHAPHMH